MKIIELIEKKKQSQCYTKEEINFIIEAVTKGEIADYQIAAWLMAVWFKGMNADETACLTEAIVNSGNKIDLSELGECIVDKHSTGGVGDKVTLILIPLLAAAGIPVAKLSGRGLGHTGGTIDKLESIKGFRTNLSIDEFVAQVKKINVAIAAQTMELTPADGKLYALRDVTATIDCLPFICSSVVSKKVASGANIIILDVKYGQGAFIKTKEQAEELSKLMVLVGEKLGRKIICVITGMEQPLGCAVGNLLEVLESIDVLQGRGPKDVRDLTLYFGAVALVEARQAKNISEATKILEDLIRSGKAYQKFREMVISQGGDIESIEKGTFEQAKYQIEVLSDLNGYVQKCDALSIAKTCKFLGAGRSKKEDAINHKVGIVLSKKISDEVLAGESLAVVYADDESFVQQAVEQIKQAYEIGVQKPIKEELIYKTVC